ncbi:unnamed protein product, partial [Polarella glacialis]
GNSLRLADEVFRMVSLLRKEGNTGPVLISLDAQHSFDATLAELHLYARGVDVGSYVILQDARLDATYNRPGPLAAGARLLEDVPRQWEWDRDIEVYGHTQHLWLRRVAWGPPVALGFTALSEDLVSTTPFRKVAEGASCIGGSEPLQEIAWAGSLLACQAICLRMPDDACKFLTFFPSDPPVCVFRRDCLDMLPEPEEAPTVYERLVS